MSPLSEIFFKYLKIKINDNIKLKSQSKKTKTLALIDSINEILQQNTKSTTENI